MSFLFGFMLPVERLPMLVIGPAVTALGLAIGCAKWTSLTSEEIAWCVFDVLLGLAFTVQGAVKLKRQRAARVAAAAEQANLDRQP